MGEFQLNPIKSLFWLVKSIKIPLKFTFFVGFKLVFPLFSGAGTPGLPFFQAPGGVERPQRPGLRRGGPALAVPGGGEAMGQKIYWLVVHIGYIVKVIPNGKPNGVS